MNEETLGVDIGGVIIQRATDGADTSFFEDNYLSTPAVPDVFEALHELVTKRFGARVHLVSKAGPRVQEKTRHWLDHHGFYALTGIGPDHVHFCLERRDKAGICQKLGITHFIDDRLEVLGYLVKIVETRYLFQPDPSEVQRFLLHLSLVQRVHSWQEILEKELP